jgi:hypothetical protein
MSHCNDPTFHEEKYVNSSGEITHIANLNRISNLAVAHHFYAPVYLSVFLTILFQQDAADMSPIT